MNNKISEKRFIKCITAKIPVELDLTMTRDIRYYGYIHNISKNFISIINVVDDYLDGYVIFKKNEINNITEFSYDEIQKIKNLDQLPSLQLFLKQINILSWKSIFHSLNDKIPLCAVWEEGDEKSYYEGKIINVTNKEVLLHLLNENSEWIYRKKIKFSIITAISFNTRTEKELLKKYKMRQQENL